MKKVSSTIPISSKVNSITTGQHLYNLLYGFIGLFSFLSIILLIKLFSAIWNGVYLTIEWFDILVSLLGFILLYVYKELEPRLKDRIAK